MIAENDPTIPANFQRVLGLIRAQGVEQWTEGKIGAPDLPGLIYLCKFGFMTAVLTKSQIAQILGLDRAELRAMVRGWYDDHRRKGCGAC